MSYYLRQITKFVYSYKNMQEDSLYLSAQEENSHLIQELVSGSDIYNSGVSEPAVAYGHVPEEETSFLRLVHVSRAGLSYMKFQVAIAAFDFSKHTLAKVLHISERTLERIHKEKKKLSTPQTERVLEVSMLFEKGWVVFGNKVKFRIWLDRDYMPYGGIAPISLLDTSQGIRAVYNALGRIEHGVFA